MRRSGRQATQERTRIAVVETAAERIGKDADDVAATQRHASAWLDRRSPTTPKPWSRPMLPPVVRGLGRRAFPHRRVRVTNYQVWGVG